MCRGLQQQTAHCTLIRKYIASSFAKLLLNGLILLQLKKKTLYLFLSLAYIVLIQFFQGITHLGQNHLLKRLYSIGKSFYRINMKNLWENKILIKYLTQNIFLQNPTLPNLDPPKIRLDPKLILLKHEDPSHIKLTKYLHLVTRQSRKYFALVSCGDYFVCSQSLGSSCLRKTRLW